MPLESWKGEQPNSYLTKQLLTRLIESFTQVLQDYLHQQYQTTNLMSSTRLFRGNSTWSNSSKGFKKHIWKLKLPWNSDVKINIIFHVGYMSCSWIPGYIYSVFKSNQTFPYIQHYHYPLQQLVLFFSNCTESLGHKVDQFLARERDPSNHKKDLTEGKGTINRTWSIARNKYVFQMWIKVQRVFQQVSECHQVFLRNPDKVVSTRMDHSFCHYIHD